MAIRLDPFQTIVNVNWSNEEPEYIAFELRATGGADGPPDQEYAGEDVRFEPAYDEWVSYPGLDTIAWGESPGRWPGRVRVYSGGLWQSVVAVEISNLSSYGGSLGIGDGYFGNVSSLNPVGWDLGGGGSGGPSLTVGGGSLGGTITWTGGPTPEHFVATTGEYGGGEAEWIRDTPEGSGGVFRRKYAKEGNRSSRVEHHRASVTGDVVVHLDGLGFRPAGSGLRDNNPPSGEVWIICDRSPADDIE